MIRMRIHAKNPLSRVVISVSAALIVAAAALCALNLKMLHDDALAAARTTTQNLARAFAEHTARTFEAVDRALMTVVYGHKRSFVSPLSAMAAFERLRSIKNRSEVLQSVGYSNAAGDLVASSAFVRPPHFSMAASEHFRAHADGSNRGLFIGRPITTRLSGAWVVPVSRGLARLDGAFDGVATAMVDLSYFERLYTSMDIGRSQTIALLRRDATVVMRVPQDSAVIGKSLASSLLFTRYLPGSPLGTFQTIGQFDQVNRVISYAAVPGYPLVVTIGVSMAEALGGWYRQLALTVLVFVAFLALFLFINRLLIQRLESDESRRRELEAAKAEAIAANKAKSDFLSNMSHELRTPLNAILGYAELIRDRRMGPESGDVYRSYAGDIHSAGKHLLDLINGLLDLSRIEAGRWTLNETQLDLEAVIRSIIQMQQLASERARVSLTSCVPPHMPAFLADERAVTQMLLNLVFNSLKFTPPGGSVEIRAAVEGGAVTLAVRDTGVGMAVDARARLFDRFTPSADPLIRTDRGAGLGLSIVKGLVELHGGQIEVKSALGEGTEVILRFPPLRTLPVAVAA